MTRESGSKAAFDLGIHDMAEPLLELLGKLRFHTSYGQNLLAHSKEVGLLAGMMAESLGHLGLSDAIKRRTQDIDTSRTWGACPGEVWAAAYARILTQLRRPTTGSWASQCDSDLDHLYNCQGNN